MVENVSYKYRRNRRRWICAQASAVIILSLAALILFGLMQAIRRADTVYFHEKGDIDYSVHLKDNEFFEGDKLADGYVYVGELIESISADLTYNLLIDDRNAVGRYTCRTYAILEIKDKAGNIAILEREYPLSSETYGDIDNGALYLSSSVKIDYGMYDGMAREFVSRYGLTNTENSLRVMMAVKIYDLKTGDLAQENVEYKAELKLPLASAAVSPTTVMPSLDEPRALLVEEEKGGALLVILAAISFVDALAVLCLIAFVKLSATDRSGYKKRLRRLLSDYKNQIQITRSRLSLSENRVYYIDSFEEMLEIRDTMQMPILMYEDAEQLCASFFIITSFDTAYLFELKADEAEREEAELNASLKHWRYGEQQSTARSDSDIISSVKKKIRDMLNR